MAFGGVTGWQRPRRLTGGQQIFLSAAGPAVGIVIGGGLLLLAFSGALTGMPPAVLRLVDFAVWVNLGWAVLNLLPILPMDGGHIAASLAEMVAGRSGRIAARVLSVALCVVIGLWALFSVRWWILILCVVFTITNVQGLRAEAHRG
jgi:membrane-associated protease RseP (regulator of RpoE activity)